MNGLSTDESAARTWAMVAQLAIFANASIPFGGLIATVLIYALRKEIDPIAREHERNALNFEITLAIFSAIGLIVYLGLFVSAFFSSGAAAGSHGGRMSSGSGVPLAFIGPFACIAIFFAVGIASAIVSCFAARAAWMGRPFRYPVSFPFVR